ncbi:DUF2752 domain-containing protein [Aquihabitans sp. G128]|nr:DUF2752 domain-containing protein [Aquihabitans sp. G128]
MTGLCGFASIETSVDDRDQMRWLGLVAIGGLVLAAGLAVFGPLPVDIPMPTHAFGWVEPTCGLTRGSTAIVRGDLALAWRYNPSSYLVIAAGALGSVRFVSGAVTGRWLNARLHPRPLGWVAVALVVALLWAHQQRNAQFVMDSRA